MDNDSNPLQPTDEETSPTTTDQTFHSTLEELDPSSQLPEEAKEKEKETKPPHPHDPPVLPSSPYSPDSPYGRERSPPPQRSNLPPHRANPPTHPGPRYGHGGKIYPDHDTQIRSMPRSSERKHLLTRAPPRVGFQWASREEIAAMREFYDRQDGGSADGEGDKEEEKKEEKEGERVKVKDQEEVKKKEAEVKRWPEKETNKSEADFFEQEDGEWYFFGENEGEMPQPPNPYHPTYHSHSPPNPYLPPYHSQHNHPSPQSQQLSSYPFPSHWTTAYTDSLTALSQITAASSTYLSSLAESGLGRAGRSIGSAVMFSAREGAGSVRRMLSQESVEEGWAAEQVKAMRRMLEREGR